MTYRERIELLCCMDLGTVIQDFISSMTASLTMTETHGSEDERKEKKAEIDP